MKYFEKPKIRPHVIIGIPWEGFLSFPLFKKKNQSLGQKLYKSRVYHLEKRLFLEAGSYWSLRVSETKETKGVLNFWVISFFTLFVMQCCFFSWECINLLQLKHRKGYYKFWANSFGTRYRVVYSRSFPYILNQST